ncbi:cytochrome P450 [Aphanothece hegewaldii CCALA 016]|uniref:Cytochrome P450 n=2 Tax=Aphanothece TaxID=1121 RepID=A0A2T1M255_9CHRO|nr:cytochrome P450 [Aphanothece hegewaldii CCALA 016]
MVQLNEPATNRTKELPNASSKASILRMLWVIVKPFNYLETMHKRYGDFYLDVFSAFPPTLIISNPQAIEKVFTLSPELFLSGPANAILKPLLGATAILFQDGDRHTKKRKLLMPPFHGERMRAYGQMIREITLQVMAEPIKKGRFTARPVMQEISLGVILKAVFGLREGERYEKIRSTLIKYLDFFNVPLNATFLFFPSLQKDLGAWSPWGRFLRHQKTLYQLLDEEIQERREQQDFAGEDIMSLLLSARDEEGQGISDEELRDELLALLFAGHETTALALSWALYWIHYLPEVRDKLLTELSTLNIAEVDPSEIARLPYLSAVVAETLRLYPVALFTFSRVLQKPMELMGYQIPQGVGLAIPIYMTHQRPELYPEPKKFIPDRFLERQFSPYEYLPFGGGNRRCIGAAFALFEMKIVLATILTNYSLTLVDQRPVLPVRRGIVFAPAGGVRLKVKS